jgi:hypothetical protein
MKSVALRRRFVYGTSGEGHGTTVLVTKVCVPIVWSCTRVLADKSKACSRIDPPGIRAGSKIAFQMRCLP